MKNKYFELKCHGQEVTHITQSAWIDPVTRPSVRGRTQDGEQLEYLVSISLALNICALSTSLVNFSHY